jgi:hypothetical protein
MLNHHRPSSGRLDRSAGVPLPPRLSVTADADRAPITFGWLLYRDDAFTGQYHLETLYRLDRVGTRVPGHGDTSALQPSQYYGQGAEALREMLRVRQHALLPTAPAGYRWLGPQLIEEVPCGPAGNRSATGARATGVVLEVPQDRRARLAYASDLAARILCRG